MLLSFVACNRPNDFNNSNDSVESSFNNTTDGGDNENITDENSSSNASDILNADTISYVYGSYSEGCVFVNKKNDNQNLYCIDKSGKTIFSVVCSSDEFTYTPGLAYTFSKGLAHIPAGICDKTGKITTAQDLGGDKILRCDFAADYILVSRSTTSFMGTTYELATFNTKFEKIVDFSGDFYEIYDQNKHYSFIDTYLLLAPWEDKYLNLCTGEVSEGKSSLRSKIQLERDSDLWESEGYWGSIGGFYIYSKLDDLLSNSSIPERTTVLDLSQNEKYTKINQIGNFKNGVAPVTFEVRDGDGNYIYYYTIMDEEGNFKFEPVKIGGNVINYSFDNGYFVCNVAPKGGFSLDRRLEVYSIEGKFISSMDYTLSSWYNISNVSISEGVILAEINNVYYFYDIDLKPIF